MYQNDTRKVTKCYRYYAVVQQKCCVKPFTKSIFFGNCSQKVTLFAESVFGRVYQNVIVLEKKCDFWQFRFTIVTTRV